MTQLDADGILPQRATSRRRVTQPGRRRAALVAEQGDDGMVNAFFGIPFLARSSQRR